MTLNEKDEGLAKLAAVMNKQEANQGGNDDFRHFFSRPAYLTASAQLHLETMTSTLGKVYTLSPSFRAEKSLTRHHLAEFYMLEAELIDMRTLDQLMDLAEDFLRQVSLDTLNQLTRSPVTSFSSSSSSSSAHITSLIDMFESKKRFERVTYEQALEILNNTNKKKKTFKKIEFGQDLNKEQEKLLVEHFGGRTPVFVSHYPREIKPFYMRQSISDDRRVVENFDLLVPRVGEIIGGSLREYRLDMLEDAMRRQGLDLGQYSMYLETKRFGGMRLGGFGLGLERLVQFLFDVENIRDTCAFPRSLYNCKM